jgi:hypothetical protein
MLYSTHYYYHYFPSLIITFLFKIHYQFLYRITHFLKNSMNRKLPNKILIICPNFKYYPTVSSEIDFSSKNTEYDLLIFVNKNFKLNLEFPGSIANSEIWFERGEYLTEKIFNRAMEYYSNSIQRNGL